MFDNIEFNRELLKILLEKGFLGILIISIGYFVKKSIEKWKSSDTLSNEITKVRIERISKFYDLFSEYEHWINRLIIHTEEQLTKNTLYLNKKELEEAIKNADDISKTIGFELNQMRFWINDDIYHHTRAQLEIFKEMKNDILVNGKIKKIKEYARVMDSVRINIDKLIPYLKMKQHHKLIKYDRSVIYRKGND